MGNVSASLAPPEVYRKSRPGEWIKQGTTGYSEIVRSSQTGQLAQQYTLPIDRRISRTDDIRRYEFRRTQNLNLVRILQVEKEDSGYVCQGQDFQSVKTQYIPKRLSEINELSDIEGLYVLQQSFIGYKTIHKFHGTFTISDEMIGFTLEGQVRVWLNENFARNLPDIQNIAVSKITRQAYKPQNQTVLIDQIYDIVEVHVVGKCFPQKFHNIYTQNPPKTFSEAIDIVRGYVASYHVTMPQGIRIGNQSQRPTQSDVQSISVEQPQILPPQNISLFGENSQFSTNNPPLPITGHRSLSVGSQGGNQSQLIVSKPSTSAFIAPLFKQNLTTKPNTSLTPLQIKMLHQTSPVVNPSISLNDFRQQQPSPSKPPINLPNQSLVNTIEVKASPQAYNSLLRPAINFRTPATLFGTSLNNNTAANIDGIHLQFPRKPITKSVNNSFPAGLLNNIVNVNSRYLNRSIKNNLQANSSFGQAVQPKQVDPIPSHSKLSKKLITPPASYTTTNTQSFSNNKTNFSFESSKAVHRPIPVVAGLLG